MADTPKKAQGWTDAQKLAVVFQLLANAGPGIWKDFQVPEGRTIGAVKIMIDREKKKVQKAMGGEDATAGATPKKRAADDDEDEGTTPKKPKAKTPRKKKVVAAVQDDEEEEEEEEKGEAAIKPEVQDED